MVRSLSCWGSIFYVPIVKTFLNFVTEAASGKMDFGFTACFV
jgi:hypothetical protein